MRYFNFLIVLAIAVLAFFKYEEISVLKNEAALIKRQHVEARLQEHRDEIHTLTRYIETDMEYQNVKNSLALQRSKKYLDSYYRTLDEYWYNLAREELESAIAELDRYRKG
jgi:phosphotransacetylase